MYLSLYVCGYALLRSPHVLFSGFLIYSSVGSLGFHLFSSFLLCFGSPLESSGFGAIVTEDGDLT
jgi:hypothetical protein